MESSSSFFVKQPLHCLDSWFSGNVELPKQEEKEGDGDPEDGRQDGHGHAELHTLKT
jgi:hypothetical protein